MTCTAATGQKRSPWLSIWLRPGNTIDQVLATKPTLFFLLLPATGGYAALAVSTLIGEEVTTPLLDWRLLAGLAGLATVLALAGIYLNGFLLSWSGRIFGGRASPAQMRAVVAWGSVPLCASLAISLVMITGVRLVDGAAAGPASALVVVAQSVIDVAVAIWTSIALLIMIKRVQAFGWWRALFNLAAGSVLGVLLVVLPIGTFLLQPFNIPSGSMAPTVLNDDRIFVSKYAYGYSQFSLPFLPLEFAGRILPVEPRRGDVVVFRGPRDTSIDYLKRIVGMPGDRIQMKDGVLIINDVPVPRERAEDFIDEQTGERVKSWRETLPNGVSYFALDLLDSGFLDNTQVYTVPPGHYFMLGDNLDNSNDSRMLSAIGYVPFENLIGRAEFIYFSLRRDGGRQPGIRFGRIGRTIR